MNIGKYSRWGRLAEASGRLGETPLPNEEFCLTPAGLEGCRIGLTETAAEPSLAK
jgi:hypothetical protein